MGPHSWGRIHREQFAGQFRECRRLPVFFRDKGLDDVPGNANPGIAPEDGVFVRGIVKIATLIEKLNAFGQGEKPMSKPARNIDLILSRGGEHDAGPLRKRRRTSANVHGDVQRFSLYDAAELGLSTMQLIMEATQSSFYRTGVIVLYEDVVDSGRGEARPVITFDKETAGVAEDVGAKLPHFWKRCRDLLQANSLAF